MIELLMRPSQQRKAILLLMLVIAQKAQLTQQKIVGLRSILILIQIDRKLNISITLIGLKILTLLRIKMRLKLVKKLV